MLVHNCFGMFNFLSHKNQFVLVEDGQGEKRLVIDERGLVDFLSEIRFAHCFSCHVDLVLGDPTYVKDLNMSYRESNVFKFADKIGVRFLCEIKLCLKMDGGCEGITVSLKKCAHLYFPF